MIHSTPQVNFAVRVLSWWPWIVGSLYALMTSIFVVPRIKYERPYVSLALVFGGAAFLTVILGMIEALDWGLLTFAGTLNIVRFMWVLAVTGAIAAFCPVLISIGIYGFWKDRQRAKRQ
jgi:hypothetical protein